ncbi:hypothetical protein J3E68DRAFT_406776 [Trichoderma sp. SZMC 28012]
MRLPRRECCGFLVFNNPNSSVFSPAKYSFNSTPRPTKALFNMADEKAGELPPAVTSYLQEEESDLTYRLVKIGQDDGSNMDRINTDVAKTPKTTVAADEDHSPVSDAGTTHSWENISHGDANEVATPDDEK